MFVGQCFPILFFRQEVIENKWQKLLTGLEKRKNLLVGLNEVTPVIADIEQVSSQLKIFEVC